MKARKKKIKNLASEKKSKNRLWAWSVKILILTLFLSFGFGLSSQLLLSNAGLLASLIVILFLLVISYISDLIGAAAMACDEKPFAVSEQKKVKGAAEALFLAKHADKVSGVCDVIGDICATVSGAAGASIVLRLVAGSSSASLMVLTSAAVSAWIAGLTVFGKALLKTYALHNANHIILLAGKALSMFSFNKNKSK